MFIIGVEKLEIKTKSIKHEYSVLLDDNFDEN